MKRRHLFIVASIATLGALSACSGPYLVRSDVSTFGSWPSGRAPGTYAIERLPSQKDSQLQVALETDARSAIEAAGFKPAADAKSADVLVTLGARVNARDPSPWDDPLWTRWRGPRFYGGGWVCGAYYRHGPWGPCDPLANRFDREVAVLVRDRNSGEAIYEAHASNDGNSTGDSELFSAMFGAALQEFPATEPKPHEVSVQVMR